MATEYQLKNVNLSSLKDGSKQEAEVEGIEEGKVLLLKTDGKIHAISPKCTHYGAPLVKGILSGDRLTCPWHGGMMINLQIMVIAIAHKNLSLLQC